MPPNSDPDIEVIPSRIVPSEKTIPFLNPNPLRVDDSTSPGEITSFDFEKYSYLSDKPAFEKIGYFWYRDFYCLHLKVYSASFDPGNVVLNEFPELKIKITFPRNTELKKTAPLVISSAFDKVLSSSIVNSSMAEQFRSGSSGRLDNDGDSWINFDQEYVKLSSGIDGIFRIYKSDLDKLGIPVSGIDPQKFRLYESGREIPIRVYGESDGSFDNNDFIEYFASKNYSTISPHIINEINEPYNDYMNRYTDSTYYFLTWGSESGKRFDSSAALHESISDTLDFYTSFFHFEENTMYQPLSASILKNQDPEWLETNAWIWGWLGVQSINYSFIPDDLVTDKTAAVYFKCISAGSDRATDSHNLTISVNNEIIDSQTADRGDRILLGDVFNSSILNSGTNDLRIINEENGSSVNVLAYDWYEIEYPRNIKALDDSLIFELKYDFLPGEKIIKVENINTPKVNLYKIQGSLKRINNINLVGNTLFFADTISPGDKYILLSDDKIKKPVFHYYKKFTNLSSPDNSADYIGISHKSLETAAAEYINFISDRYELKTSLVLINDIYDEFSFGYPQPEAVKSFLIAANKNWNNPKPSYLLLLGSACYDYNRYVFKQKGFERNINLVPSYGEPVSDSWFVMWDSTNTLLPQMFVGRIPAVSPDNISVYLEKHRNYLDSPYDEFNKRTLFFSGGDGNNPSQIELLKSTNENIIKNYSSARPLSLISPHFYKTVNPRTDFGPYESKFIQGEIEKGGLAVSYIGHSGTRTWDNSISEAGQLDNALNRGFLVTDFGCSTNKFAEPDIDAFGKLFLFSGQAIGYVGNSSLGYLSTSTTVSIYFYESLFGENRRGLGDAHLSAKIKMFERLGNTRFIPDIRSYQYIAGRSDIRTSTASKTQFDCFRQFIPASG